jgi:hypothetical protein
VTGESTGGNLATSLCIKLCRDGLIDFDNLRDKKEKGSIKEEDSKNGNEDFDNVSSAAVRLPDALLLWYVISLVNFF